MSCIGEIQSAYSSSRRGNEIWPTLLVGGRDVTEHPPGVGPACRLDLLGRDRISRAIEAAIALAGDRAIDHVTDRGSP
jgi:hypothetical protein